MSEEITVGRVARAAGITRDQARSAIAAMPDPPSGGPAYVKRMAYIREAAEAMGLNVWRMSDATLEKRLCKGPRMAALVRYAKDADALPSPERAGA